MVYFHLGTAQSKQSTYNTITADIAANATYVFGMKFNISLKCYLQQTGAEQH